MNDSINHVRTNTFVSKVWVAGTWVMLWPIRRSFSIFESLAEYLILKAKTTAQRILFVFMLASAMLMASTLMYTGFFRFYMPVAEIARPVFFNFKICDSGHGLCSFPSANVTFRSKEGTLLEFLGPGQNYHVDLDLDMPDSPTNRDMGMFQVVIKMFDRKGQVTAQSTRPAIPKYRSLVMRLLDIMVLWPFYFTGWMDQKLTMSVELFSRFVDDYYRPSVGANIEIHSYNIQFYSAKLKFLASFTGLKYCLYYWPVTSAVCGILCNMTLLTIFFLGALYRKSESLRVISQALELDVLQQRNVSNNKGDGSSATTPRCPNCLRDRNVSNNKGDEGISVSVRAVVPEDGEEGDNSGADSEDDTDCEETNVENNVLGKDIACEEPAEYDLPLMTELRQRIN